MILPGLHCEGQRAHHDRLGLAVKGVAATTHIGARAKGLARPSHDDDTHCVVFVAALIGLTEPINDGRIHRVVCLGAVERNDGNPVLYFKQ